MTVHHRLRDALVAAATAFVAVAVAIVPLSSPANALVPQSFDQSLWGVDGRVRKIVQTSSAIFVAGLFNNVKGPNGELVPHKNIAALDPATGQALPLTMDTNGEVYTIVLSADGSTLYLGGKFTTVNGVARKRAAALDVATGAVLAFDPKADAIVEAIAQNGNVVYLGGNFLKLGSTPRTRLATVSAISGNPLATGPQPGNPLPNWAATADAVVHDIEVTADHSRVVIAGEFNRVSGSPFNTQRSIASLDPTTGALQPWASHPTYKVFDIAASHAQLFAAAGGSGGHAMGYDLATGKQQWLALGDGDSQAVAYQNGVLYVGGHFQYWQGVKASHIVALAPTTGVRLTWGVTVNSVLGVWAVNASGGHLAVGGDFTKVNNKLSNHVARFTESVDLTPPTVPGRPTGVSNTPTTIDLTWAASTDNQSTMLVYRIYRDGGSIPVGSVTTASTTTVTWQDSHLVPGSTHTYAITADDGDNFSALTAPSDPVTVQSTVSAVLTALQAFDTDANGRVDQITAEFSDTVSCVSPCLTPWMLTNLPIGTSLQSVSVSGDTATLTLTEGTGALKTDVGTAKVALAAAPNGIVDTGGDQSSFAATTPADRMSPIPVSITSANVGTQAGVMEPGDTFTVTFTEPLLPASVIAANAKQTDPLGVGNDSMIIVGLTDGAIDLGSDTFVTPDGGAMVYQNSTLTLLNSGTTVKSTIVAPCASVCAAAGPGTSPTTFTFTPEPFLRDAAGNGAIGSLNATLTIF